MPVTPRARVRLLARSGRVEPGLFVPLVLAQAAEIEALPLDAFLCDATKLAKGLTALHQALRTDGVVVAGGGLLGEAAGSAERVDAAVEATARLASTLPGDPALVAALTGPATAATQLGTADVEAAGALVLDGLKRFLEAGVNLVLLVEERPPLSSVIDAWRSALTPLSNVARFHQGAALVVFESMSAGAVEVVPPSVGVCVPEGTEVPGPPARPRGVALPVAPKEWLSPGPGAPLVTTAGVVPAEHSFAEVLDACGRLRTEGP
jgi:hypothetical protein